MPPPVAEAPLLLRLPTKRRPPQPCLPPIRGQVVGWPPVRIYRKNLVVVSVSKSKAGEVIGEGLLLGSEVWLWDSVALQPVALSEDNYVLSVSLRANSPQENQHRKTPARWEWMLQNRGGDPAHEGLLCPFFAHLVGGVLHCGGSVDSQGDAIRTPKLITDPRWWRPCVLCPVSTTSTFELQRCMLSYGTAYSAQAAVYMFFVSFELIRQRRVRAPLMLILRFNGEDDDPPGLSSVMVILDLQLDPLPRRHLPTRLLVEPMALWLVRLREAPEEYDRRCFESEFSPDPWQAPYVLFVI